MFGNSPLERAFLRDMLAYGIPVTEAADMMELYSVLADASVELDFYDLVIEDNNLVFGNKNGDHCVTIKRQVVEDEIKLIFYTPAYETAFENADVVGRVLLLVVTLCSTRNWLNIKSQSSKSTEQSYEFDSDFI